MANERKYYVLCSSNCKFESMTKEQILAAITQAVETGEIKDVDTGFVTTIKEQNNGAGLSFWVGTQAEYNALETKATNCFYIVTDDTFGDDINAAVEDMKSEINGLTGAVENYGQRLDEHINKNGAVIYDADTNGKIETGTLPQFKNIVDGEKLKVCNFVKIKETINNKWVHCLVTVNSAETQITITGGGCNTAYGLTNGQCAISVPTINLVITKQQDEDGKYKWYINNNKSCYIAMNGAATNGQATSQNVNFGGLEIGSIIGVM